MRLVVCALQKVDVVCRDQSEPEVLRHFEQNPIAPVLLLDAVVVEFDEEIVFAEDVPILAGKIPRARLVVCEDRLVDLSVEAPAERDEPVAVGRQELFVDSWLVVKPIEVCQRHEFNEVLVSRVVLGEQCKVERVFAVLASLAFRMRPGGDVGLNPDDWFDAGLFRLLVKLDCAEKIAVVGERHGRHPAGFDFLHQLRDPDGTIKQRVF